MSDNLANYKNNIYGFSFNYNKNWSIETDTNTTGQTTSAGDEVVVQIFSNEVIDNFRDNFNIVVNAQYKSNNDLFTDIDNYFQSFINYPEVQNFNLLNKSKVVLGGREAAKVSYTATINGLNVAQTQWYTIDNGKLFTIGYTAVPASYEQHANDIDVIVTSFQF